MNTKIIALITVILPLTGFTQELTTANFSVNGKCGMCKQRIEQAATSVEGVQSASWNSQEQKVTIQYDHVISSPDLAQLAISRSGYDTEKLKADDVVYQQLPACCQYRSQTIFKGKKSIKKGSSCH